MSKTKEAIESVRIKELEDQVEQLALQLQDYEQVKEQLTQAQKRETLASLSGGIAHDFNNILHCILGYTEMALSGEKNNLTNVDIFLQIQAAVERGRDLAQRFLVFGRKSDHRQEELNFNKIIGEVEYLLSHTMPRNIATELRLDSDLFPVSGDVGQCEQIVMNLCINAMDAMPNGGKLIIETENIRLADNSPLNTGPNIAAGSYIHISVSDTGVGISEDVIENIFTPFFTTKEEGRGSGLGLSVVSSIVKSHGGYVDCISSPGSGSTFGIYIPAATIQYTEKIIPEDKYFFGNASGREVILFVDDEEAIMRIGKHFLESCGYNVLTAGDGDKALEIYQNNNVDLVVMDVGLPGMGGDGFLKNLQSKNAGVKVLAISGYPPYSDEVNALGLDKQKFLQKPFRWEELMNKMRVILDGSTIPVVEADYRDDLRE